MNLSCTCKISRMLHLLLGLVSVSFLLCSSSATGHPIRLLGSGSSLCSGRVEIYYNNLWGTVCDDFWDLNDAQVVCRQMGCGPAVRALQSASFGEGTGPIWLDDVVCTGSETSLSECSHRAFGSHDCRHSEDAGVVCSVNQIRLVGPSQCSGRVEINYNNTWRTVCDDSWDINDAQVVCRQLGCGPALNATQLAFSGQGTGQIWLGEVNCTGSETYLTECSHNGFGSHDCGHSEDAGVVCSDPVKPNITISPTDFITLGQTLNITCSVTDGREGGTFILKKTSDSFIQSQFSSSSSATFQILHFNFTHEGSYRCLFKTSDSEKIFNTLSSDPVSLYLSVPFPLPSDPLAGDQIRLVGPSQCSGRVEIYHNDEWGTVCDDFWDLNDAQVVCRQLGCGSAINATQLAFFGQGTGPIWLDDVTCRGSESSLSQCPHREFGSNDCGRYEDAGVVCSGHQIRLDGPSRCSGRVEMNYINTWRTVCDDSWDIQDAQVVCRQLGCGSAISVPRSAHLSPGTGQIWPNVTCTGSESSLFECSHRGSGTQNSRCYEGVEVICSRSSRSPTSPWIPLTFLSLIGLFSSLVPSELNP